MSDRGIRGYGILLAAGLLWFVTQPGARPLSAQQAGGLPELQRRLTALESKVAALQTTSNDQSAEIAALTARLATAEGSLTALNTRLAAVEAKTEPLSVSGSDFFITRKNVWIQDGSGDTNSDTGLGNLTIGYNGSRGANDRRTGAHNLILGDQNNYTSYGGLVAGTINEIEEEYATVTGGAFNVASGNVSSVTGGVSNTASGIGASVSGGTDNGASGLYGSVSGGIHNRASGDYSAVSGGNSRSTLDRFNWAAGDLFQAL